MENDPIMSLRSAIEDLTTEIRTVRGAWTTGGFNVVHSSESIIADVSEDQDFPVSTQPVIDHGGITPNEPSAASVADINDDVEKAQQELDQLVLALCEKDAKLEAARNALTTTEQSVIELEERKRQLATEVEALEGTRCQFQIMQQESAALEEHLRAMKSEATGLEVKSRIIDSREEELRIGMGQVKNASELLRKLWPEWLCGEGLSHWKEFIERDVFSENSLPSFSLLFAAIHNYTASLRDPDNRILLDALRDLGRRLYQWLKDFGKSEESIAEIVEAWALAINTECEERCSIQVAAPGNPANNKWMSFTPRGGSAPDVASVRSWCVSDNQGRPIHRAEVTV
jgi:hypothetical protein